MGNDDKKNLFKNIVGDNARLPEAGPLKALKAKPFMGTISFKDFTSVKSLTYRSQVSLSPQGGVVSNDVTRVKSGKVSPSISGKKK